MGGWENITMSGLFTLSDNDNVNDDADDVADAFVTCEGH